MPDVLLGTATTNFSNTVVALVMKRLEEELRLKLVHLAPGHYTPGTYMPGTNKLRYIAYRDLSIVTGTPTPGTPPWLTEGTKPDSEAMSITFDEFSAFQAGRIIGLTDVGLTQSPHDLIAVAADRIAFNAAATIDQYVADQLSTGTTVTYASTAVSRITVAAGMVVTGALIKKVVAALKSANVPTYPDGYYHAYVHPKVIYDIQSDTAVGGWMDANKYTDSMPLLTGEIGRYAGVRFMESTAAHIFTGAGAGAIDVYSTFVSGPDSYGFGDMQTLRSYYVAPGGDHADPLAQKGYVGWKAMFGCDFLDSNGARYRRIESATNG